MNIKFKLNFQKATKILVQPHCLWWVNEVSCQSQDQLAFCHWYIKSIRFKWPWSWNLYTMLMIKIVTPASNQCQHAHYAYPLPVMLAKHPLKRLDWDFELVECQFVHLDCQLSDVLSLWHLLKPPFSCFLSLNHPIWSSPQSPGVIHHSFEPQIKKLWIMYNLQMATWQDRTRSWVPHPHSIPSLGLGKPMWGNCKASSVRGKAKAFYGSEIQERWGQGGNERDE